MVKDQDHCCQCGSRPDFDSGTIVSGQSVGTEQVDNELIHEETGVKVFTSYDNLPTKKLNCCTFCGNTGDNYTIQCSKCESWCHNRCTRLPIYQLYIYQTTNRKYTCENCADVPQSADNLIVESVEGERLNLNTKSENRIERKCQQVERGTSMDENIKNVEDTYVKISELESQLHKNIQKIEELVIIRDKLEAHHLSDNHQIEKLTNKEKSEKESSQLVEEILEKGMVKILDQINNINNNISERLNLGEKNETQTSEKESLNNLKEDVASKNSKIIELKTQQQNDKQQIKSFCK